MTPFTINQKFHAVGARPPDQPPSENLLKVAEMFGIGLDESYEVSLYAGLAIDVRPGDVVFITGPSGSGKSVLLARLAEAIAAAWPAARLVSLADAVPDGRPVIDLLSPGDGSGLPLPDALRLLSAAGLADAFLLLREARELSDGQRYRLRLAFALAHSARGESPGATCLVADEFCSTLDRLCARAVAYRVRRLADSQGLTVLAASAHDDLVEDLAPDVLIVKHEGPAVEVRYADASRQGAGR